VKFDLGNEICELRDEIWEMGIEKYVREIFPLERWLCKAKGVRGMFFCKITNRQNEIGIV
jgi:hypothetical protein